MKLKLLSKLTIAAATIAVAGMAHAQFGGINGSQMPYMATVGDDNSIPQFYISPKLLSYADENGDHPATAPESFDWSRSTSPANFEVCDPEDDFDTNENRWLPAVNAGYYEWLITLPKKPNGNLNIVVQCGLIKPGGSSINGCAGETGERTGSNCTRRPDQPNRNGVKANALPYITAQAEAGPGDGLSPFNLTAYRNPGSYNLSRQDDRERCNGCESLKNSASLQVLAGNNSGNNGSRILLKACMSKSILVKKPVAGQINALGQEEFDLEAGDQIRVRLDFPRGHTMNVFCHAQAVRVQGLGIPLTSPGSAED